MLTNDFKNLIKHNVGHIHMDVYYIKYLPINNISKWSYYTCTEKDLANAILKDFV